MQVLKADVSKQILQQYGPEASVDIAVYPPDASLTDFHWRVSLATVESNGLFGRYCGVDRSVALLQGGVLAMAFDGAVARRIRPGPGKLAFDGEATTFGCPLDGPVIDLSVMSRRAYCQHKMNWLEWEGEVALFHQAGTVGLLFVVSGEVDVGQGDRLSAHDTLLLATDGTQYLSLYCHGKACAWWVEFLSAQ